MRAIKQEQTELTKRINALDEKLRVITTMIEDEDAKWGQDQPTLFDGPPKSKVKNLSEKKSKITPQRTGLSQFIFNCLSDMQSHSVSEIVEKAKDRGITFGEKSPGRVIHFALMGMLKGHKIKRQENGEWRILQN